MTRVETKKTTFFNRKVVAPLLVFLQQGMSPNKLAMTVGFGVIWGTFPLIGTNTLICIATAFAFKLNQAAIQIVNYAVYPLQLALLVPLIKLGFWLTGKDSSAYQLDGIWQVIQEDRWKAVQTLGEIVWMAVTGWSVFALIAFFGLWLSLRRVFARMANK